MPDQEITCAECGGTFQFTQREQDYYRERGLSTPKRCKPCRDVRRAQYGGGSASAPARTDSRQRYEIICSQCGEKDTVPFQPKPGRPVLCSSCYQ